MIIKKYIIGLLSLLICLTTVACTSNDVVEKENEEKQVSYSIESNLEEDNENNVDDEELSDEIDLYEDDLDEDYYQDDEYDLE